MAMGAGIMDFVQRFQTLQLQRDTSDELIKDLLIYSEGVESGLRQENAQLRNQLNDAQLDLSDATKSRRDLQQQLQQLESRNSSLTQDNHYLKNYNPFVIVLIDGDGLFFKDVFVKQGIEGGKKAAYALRAAILKQCGEHANEVEIIAKIYANLSGLARAMRRDLSIENESDFRDFALGFTQAKASFDFIDVGHGKERADNKIKETTRWNLRNLNCKQVILGISHDAGYAPFLDELFTDDAIRRRVTLVEGYPTVRELVSTGVHILNMSDTLFRAEKLVDKTSQQNVPVWSSPAALTPASLAQPSLGAPSIGSPSVTPATSTTSTPAPAPATYARAIGTGNASPPPQITLPMQIRSANSTSRQQTKPQAPSWNPGPRGLDPPIQVSQTALESIKKRKDSNKLCNNHYLRGPCVKGDACCFEHKYKPSKDEINAIAFLTRLNPCANGQDCDVEDCIYGHHCPSVRDGICTHPFCKFEAEDHPPGTKFRTKIHEF